MKSALFVDFDNVYSGLRRLDQTIADRFAQSPLQWMNWVVDSLAPPEHAPAGARRRILVRRCYLNPQAYQRFRPSFNVAGFEIIDCPSLTGEGKTSTDIHMVLDIIDLLQHEVHYDEFIVFSADADFTPVLRKLRRWDRRTTVLAIGFPAAAYRASADLLIDQDEFVRQALGFRDPEEPMACPPSAQVEPRDTVSEAIHAPQRPTLPTPTITAHAAAPSIEVELARIADLIRQEVTRSAQPTPCARLASLILEKHGALAADWNGKQVFRKFVESLELSPIAFAWGDSGGYAYSPALHQALPEQTAGEVDEDWLPSPDLLPIARQIHDLTGVPLLPPPKYRALFEAIAADIAAEPFDLNETGKRVRDRCRDAGQVISRADVTFVLRGLLLRGHSFGQGKDQATGMARMLADNVRSLCLREQMLLDNGTNRAIGAWIVGAGDSPPASPSAGTEAVAAPRSEAACKSL